MHPEVKEKNRERERKRREVQRTQGPCSTGITVRIPSTDTLYASTHTQHPSPTIPAAEKTYVIDTQLNRSTHPRDFFTLATIFDEKMYNEAINSLTIADDDLIQRSHIDELDLMMKSRANIV